MNAEKELARLSALTSLKNRSNHRSLKALGECKNLLENSMLIVERALVVKWPDPADYYSEVLPRLEVHRDAARDATTAFRKALRIQFEETSPAVKGAIKRLNAANKELKKALEDLNQYVADMESAAKAAKIAKELVGIATGGTSDGDE